MLELENQHFATFIVKTGSGRNHHWMLNLEGNFDKEQNVFLTINKSHHILISYKGKIRIVIFITEIQQHFNLVIKVTTFEKQLDRIYLQPEKDHVLTVPSLNQIGSKPLRIPKSDSFFFKDRHDGILQNCQVIKDKNCEIFQIKGNWREVTTKCHIWL